MRGCVLLVLLAFISLAICQEKIYESSLADAQKDDKVTDLAEDAGGIKVQESKKTEITEAKDPFFSRRRRSYARRRRSYVRRRRSYVRRRRSYVRRRRSYVRRRRSYVRRRRSYLRRRRSHIRRRRRSYVRRRRSYLRRRRSYVRRRRRSYVRRRRRSYVRRRRRSYVRRRRRRSYVRRRRSYARRRRSYARRRSYQRRRSSRRRKAKPIKCIPRSNYKYDACGRRCSILNGRLVNCCRVRKDFESMTKIEQKRYIRAFKIISTKKPYKRTYDALIKMHEKYFDTRIHRKQEFLPWHRWFNLQIENLLQKVDCKVTLAYWDWSVWSHDPWNINRIWNGASGFGGNGRRGDGCVTVGPFRAGAWKTATGQCLKRGFNGNPPDADQVAITLKEPSFDKFEVMLRVNLHESIHCFINGTMCSSKSAEAPEFFLHHGFVDKIWADYQKKSVKNKMAFFSTIKQKMIGVNYYPKDFVDNDKLPGGVRVCYQDPTTHSARRIRAFLSKLSLKQLEAIERLAFSRTPESAKKMFHLSSKERKLAKSLENQAMKHVDSKRSSSIFARTLSSLERIEGFVIPKYCSPKSVGDVVEEDQQLDNNLREMVDGTNLEEED